MYKGSLYWKPQYVRRFNSTADLDMYLHLSSLKPLANWLSSFYVTKFIYPLNEIYFKPEGKSNIRNYCSSIKLHLKSLQE